MKRTLHLIIITVCLLATASCSTNKDNTLSYFSKLGESVSGELPQGGDYSIRLAPDDELEVTISSAVPSATAMYNPPVVNIQTRGELNPETARRVRTYIVDHNGNIELPVIGRLAVEGKTPAEVEQMVADRVKADVKDAYVSVRLAGFFVNVMGEVKTPQRIQVKTERFTVLDALAAAGDMTEFGQRGTVLVIREKDGRQTYNRLDMTSTDLFASPYYYLKQNDVVYVEPNGIRVDNSKYNQNNSYKLSVISTIVSATSVIASLVIALAVK